MRGEFLYCIGALHLISYPFQFRILSSIKHDSYCEELFEIFSYEDFSRIKFV